MDWFPFIRYIINQNVLWKKSAELLNKNFQVLWSEKQMVSANMDEYYIQPKVYACSQQLFFA